MFTIMLDSYHYFHHCFQHCFDSYCIINGFLTVKTLVAYPQIANNGSLWMVPRNMVTIGDLTHSITTIDSSLPLIW